MVPGLTDRIVYPGLCRIRTPGWLHGQVVLPRKHAAAAGVEVTARRFDGQIYTFVSLGGIVDDANVARASLGERLRAALTP